MAVQAAVSCGLRQADQVTNATSVGGESVPEGNWAKFLLASAAAVLVEVVRDLVADNASAGGGRDGPHSLHRASELPRGIVQGLLPPAGNIPGALPVAQVTDSRPLEQFGG